MIRGVACLTQFFACLNDGSGREGVEKWEKREEVVKRKGEGKESVKRDVVKKWKDAEN